MKRLLHFVAFVSILMFSCSIPGTLTPVVVTDTPVVLTETPVVATDTPVIPTDTPLTPTATTGPQTNVSCGKLALYLDPALASGYNCATIPEASGPDMPLFGVNPQYNEVTLQGYPLAGTFFTPHIDLFPVQRFHELAADPVDQDVADLQALLSGGTPGKNLPLLPVFNAAQEFYAKYRVVPFVNGSGIRYLTQYAQYYAPINNHEMFYSFQGLTGDGQYWISAVLPVSSPLLPADSTTIPGGMSPDDFSNHFDTYIADLTTQLNSQKPAAFAPSLAALDALVASITIQP